MLRPKPPPRPPRPPAAGALPRAAACPDPGVGLRPSITGGVQLLLRFVVVAGGVVCAVVVAETTLRWIDRQRPAASASSPSPSELAHRYVGGIPVADGVRREWFDVDPAPLDRRPLPPELAQ